LTVLKDGGLELGTKYNKMHGRKRNLILKEKGLGIVNDVHFTKHCKRHEHQTRNSTPISDFSIKFINQNSSNSSVLQGFFNNKTIGRAFDDCVNRWFNRNCVGINLEDGFGETGQSSTPSKCFATTSTKHNNVVTNQTTEIEDHQWFSKAHENIASPTDFLNQKTTMTIKGTLKSMHFVIVGYLHRYI